MRKLELAWAFAFPKATAMRSQPAIVGKTLFLPVPDSAQLFAIDIDGPPCVRWVYENEVPLRTSAGYGELPGSKRKVLVFGDLGANVHMVDATTGKQIWVQAVGLHPLSLTTGTPVLHEDRVYVPISQYEISLGGNDDHECCKSHGAVKALDARTGKTIWTAHTMEDAKPVRDRGDGKMLWGPSGAPIWTSPAIDAKRGVLYVGTGEATSEPAAPTTDAILAIDLKDGTLRWTFQATENDIFLSGCGRNRKGLNCPKETVFRDVDFGASVIIAQRSDGKDILLAGQKAGTVWALDPDNGGKLVWRQDFGEGSPLGGIHWGMASDGERVFAPINRPYGFTPPKDGGDAQKPGMHAREDRHRRSAVDVRRAARLQRRPRSTREELRDQHRPVGSAGSDRWRGRGRQPRRLAARVRCEDRRSAVPVRHGAHVRGDQRRRSERRLDRQRVDHGRERVSVRELGLWDVRADGGECAAGVQGDAR